MKKDRTLLRDERKMEKLKAKLHTDDDCECLEKKLHSDLVFPITQAAIVHLLFPL